MPFSRYKVWIICTVMGFALAVIAPHDGVSATGKRIPSAATKDRETHRLLTESPPDWSQLLLSQGANIEARNIQQETPLITSAGQGNLPLVELLLQKHADIHAADAEGNTPLHVASFNGRVKVVELLLNNGAKTRLRNSLGFSPLHQAVRRFWEVPGETEASRTENQRQIVLLLLAHDADPALEDLSHRTPAILATESNNAALAALFDARSVSTDEQTSAASPAAPPPPIQQSPTDTAPPNEPEVRQQVESTPAPESPREADPGKTDTAVPKSQPISPSSEPETETARPPDANPSEPFQPSKPSDPPITSADIPEATTESIARQVEPPTSATNTGHSETTTKPSSPPSPPEEPPAADPPISGREHPRPIPPTMPQEPAPADRAGTERPQKPGPSIQPPATPPEASPPPSPTFPAQRSEGGIPHAKAMPDLPKQESAHAPQPHTMDQPAPAVRQSNPPDAPPTITLPPSKRPDEIGALAQATTPRDPILKSEQDIRPQPDPASSYPVKEPNQVEAKHGNRDRDHPPARESSDNWILRNLGFGLGIGWTHNFGPDRIESATAVNGVVRVDADQNDLVRFMPEVHLWMDQWWDDRRWNWGPFLSLAPGANLVDALGFGLMLGYRPHPTDRYTFNLGIGGTLDFNTRVLGDGLTVNQPLPPGENQVRTKQTTAPGLLIMFSVGWDIGMPRRSPSPQEAP